MTNLNPLELIKEYSSELKLEFRDFSNDYHNEVLKIWTEIVRLQEQIKQLETQQKKSATMWGLIGGAIPVLITICISFFIYWITKKGP